VRFERPSVSFLDLEFRLEKSVWANQTVIEKPKGTCILGVTPCESPALQE
jgi:hypothetical protein